MAVRLESNGRLLRTLRGPWADERTDHTARLQLTGLAPGRRYDATIWFTSDDGRPARPSGSASALRRSTRRRPRWCGLATPAARGSGSTRSSAGSRRTPRSTRPAPTSSSTAATRSMPTSRFRRASRRRAGDVWHNLVTDGVEKVAETLDGVPRPAALRRCRTATSVRCTPTSRRSRSGTTTRPATTGTRASSSTTTATPSAAATCSPPAAAAPGRSTCRCRSAACVDRGGDGYASGADLPPGPARSAPRPVLLDMRSYRGAQRHLPPSSQPGILGPAQEKWLTEAVIASPGDLEGDLGRPAALDPLDARRRPRRAVATATTASRLGGSRSWPGSSPRGSERGCTNVVFITADVHYTAAHHYSPERAAYTDFDPFWEFVSGPLAAETFPRKDGILDQTFGPQVVFSKGNDSPAATVAAGRQPVLRPPGDRRGRCARP